MMSLAKRVSRAPAASKASRAGRPSRSVVRPKAYTNAEEECPTFIDRNGDIIVPMCADYGFRSGAGRLYMDRYGETPGSVWDLAKDNFDKELKQLRQYTRFGTELSPYNDEEPSNVFAKAVASAGGAVAGALAKLDQALEDNSLLPKLEAPAQKSEFMTREFEDVRSKLCKLKLSNDEVMAMEKAREKRDGELQTPLVVKAPFIALCWVLDILYDNKPIQVRFARYIVAAWKFWVLETVARIPYFAYISILHLYESVGFWRAGAELRKIHFAEEWNEMHHLQIMESLGGDLSWFDRFVAEHSAIAYYWLLIGFYLVNPKMAYNFMQRVELHAMDTYAVFVEANKDALREIPPPRVALSYYLSDDLYMFDEFQRGNEGASKRRPSCNNLLDVFTNIRDDEFEHVKTMDACQKETIAKVLAQKRLP